MNKFFDILAFLLGKASGGGGGDITVESKSIAANGTYTAPAGKAYSPVTANVPNSYAAGDEGKVVSNGTLVAQGSDTATQNGTVDTTLISSLEVNVSGGGSLEYESGSWTPTEDTNHGAILFQNAHTEAPVFYAVCDVSNAATISNGSALSLVYGDFWKLFGAGYPYNSGGTYYRYAAAVVPVLSNGSASAMGSQMGKKSSEADDSSDNAPRYWAKETGIYPWSGNSTRYWRSGRTYKWIAIWKPET